MPRALTALAAALFMSAIASAQEEAPTGLPKGPPPTPVRVANAAEESLAPRKRVFGELRALRRATIATEESGIVREVLVREGDRVERGATLVRLDGERLELEIAGNAAALEAALATVREREAIAAREERDLDLVRKAAAQGGTNQRELSDAESAVAIARAQVAQSRAAVVVIEQQRALLANRLSDLDVRAPFDGVVTMRHAEMGAWVAEGGPVADLIDTGTLEAWFEVPQELYGAAVALAAESAKGLTRAVPIEIDAATGVAVAAFGMRIVPEVDPRSRTFRSVLRVVNKDELLAPGLALTAFVPAGTKAPRIVIPKDAVLRGDAAPFVYVVRGGMAMPVNVRIAFPLADEVALEPGSIAAGDEVVTEGNERLMGPTPVAPIVGEPSAAAGASSVTPAVAGKAATE